MQKVLFIGTSFYDFAQPEVLEHLRKKFEGLSTGIKCYVLARGRPYHKKIWGADFYLLPNRFLYWLTCCKLAFFLCLTKKIETIIAQSPLLEGFIGVVLKWLLRMNLIVEIHGDWWDAPFLSKKRMFKNLQKRIVPLLSQFSLKRADKIRAISNWTKEQAMKIVPDKPYFVFPTFTDIDSFLEEKEISYDNFILFVGALEKVKAVDILIDAFAKIEKEFPAFKLVIIGAGSEMLNLKSKVLNLGLEDRVVFQGRLSLRDTKNIMQKCYCLVLPSRSEGLGRVLMEAGALSKPVIGSNVGGIPDLIKDGYNGFLFEKDNSDELAEKLKTLLSDKGLALKMGWQGRDFVQKNFSNQKYIENYLKMIYFLNKNE